MSKKTTKELTKGERGRDIEITFPYIDDGTLETILQDILRSQEDLDLDGEEIILHSVEVWPDEITADISVVVSDDAE